MDYKGALRSLLVDDPAVSGIIGNRMFPNFLPEGVERPAIWYEQDGTNRDPRVSGGLVEVFVDLNLEVDGNNSVLVEDLANKVRLVVDAFQGDTPSGFNFDSIFIVDDSDFYTSPDDGGDIGFLTKLIELEVNFRETVLDCTV